MRFLEIVVLSVTAGVIVTACLILPEISLSTGSLAVLATAQWPALAIDWISGYGLAALLLTAAAAPPIPGLRIGRARAISGAGTGTIQSWSLRQYLLGLGIAQVYSAIIALLALGAWRLVAVGIPPSLAAIAGSAGLRNGLGLILAGVLGALAVSAAAGRRPIATSPGLSSDTAELRLLQQISGGLAAQQSLAASDREERARVVAAVEAGQRPVLEATKNLTTAVNRLGRGLRRTLGEIKDAMPPQGEGWHGPGPGSPSSTEGATAELWTAVSALSESVARLHDLAPPAAPGEGNIPASLAQLSSELDELLLEIDRDWAEDEPQP